MRKENYIYKLDNELLEMLLKDHSSKKNIIWATDNYAHKGFGYQFSDEISIMSITGHNGGVILIQTLKLIALRNRLLTSTNRIVM